MKFSSNCLVKVLLPGMKRGDKKIWFCCCLGLFLGLFLSYLAVGTPKVQAATVDYSKEIEEIQKQIDTQKDALKKLEDQKKIYQEKIATKRKEATTLKNQLSILRDQIFERGIEIKEKEGEINAVNLSIKNIQFKILQQEREYKEQKANLASILQLINQYDKKNIFEIIFLNNSISEIFSHLQFLNTLQKDLAHSLEKVDILKQGLEIQEKDLRTNLQNLSSLNDELKNKKSKLTAEKETNQTLLEQTQGAEWKFQSLLADAIEEYDNIQAEINKLETVARQKISEEKEKNLQSMEAEGKIVFSWPVSNDGITCSFHDPDYPYRKWLGEHPAIDIRASQGTSVRAAASGYVARAKNGGMGYSYVMIIHNDTFSTVYGHLSVISVNEGDYVKRAQVIGKSGGLPGTGGAGSFSTGPHLHFEVRSNGIPVDPENYLL